MALEHESNTPLALAVREVGSQSAYGRLVGRSQTWVWEALNAGKPVQAEHVLTVEAATGISRHTLRPDIYPPEAPGAAIPRTTTVDRGAPDRHHLTAEAAR